MNVTICRYMNIWLYSITMKWMKKLLSTYSVRSLGMWLKLDSGMSVMLLLLRVLEGKEERTNIRKRHLLSKQTASESFDNEDQTSVFLNSLNNIHMQTCLLRLKKKFFK